MNKNQPVYYVPFVQIGMEYKKYAWTLKIGQEFPIHIDNSITGVEQGFVNIEIVEMNGVHIIPVPLSHVIMFVKIITPKFKLYDVVWQNYDRKTEGNGFRIYEYNINGGQVRYTSGWQEATGFSDGSAESNLTLATEEQKKHWSVDYNDSLVRDKKPELYNRLVKGGYIK